MITDQGLKDILVGLCDSRRVALADIHKAQQLASQAEHAIANAGKRLAGLDACIELLRAEQDRREKLKIEEVMK